MILNRCELAAGGVAALGFAGHAGGAVPQRTLSNRSVSPEAKALDRYLRSIYGHLSSPGIYGRSRS